MTTRLPDLNLPAIDDEQGWSRLREAWHLREDTTYLNHGSFGPPPRFVQQERDRWQRRLDQQPMDFFVREYEPVWLKARDALAEFVGAAATNLVFVENATDAMNVVADSFELGQGDEVLLNDHEYGAVLRIWERKCRRVQAAPPRIVELPRPLESREQIVEAIQAGVTDRTRIIVVSHITSPTAVILPVAEICQFARERGIAVCIDGPHAVAQLDVALDQLGCDYYTASCHKWLCAPFGSGFLYVSASRQEAVVPPLLSWGRGPTETHRDWSDEFIWTGTRSPAPFLAVPAAIEFLEHLELPAFRDRTHYLATQVREMIGSLTGLAPLTPGGRDWFGSMAYAPLPRLNGRKLQQQLWTEHGIEVPIIDWNDQSAIRVSCHLYNGMEELERLVAALRNLLPDAVREGPG